MEAGRALSPEGARSGAGRRRRERRRRAEGRHLVWALSRLQSIACHHSGGPGRGSAASGATAAPPAPAYDLVAVQLGPRQLSLREAWVRAAARTDAVVPVHGCTGLLAAGPPGDAGQGTVEREREEGALDVQVGAALPESFRSDPPEIFPNLHGTWWTQCAWPANVRLGLPHSALQFNAVALRILVPTTLCRMRCGRRQPWCRLLLLSQKALMVKLFSTPRSLRAT